MKKKNITGVLVMAGLVLVSLPLGTNRSFAKLQEKVEKQYYYDNAGYVLYEGLDNREAAASNLVTVAKRYTDSNAKLADLAEELEYRVSASQNIYNHDFAAEAEANKEMGKAAQALYEELEKTQLSEKDAKYPRQMISQMESEQDKIERSSYNDAAREFNARLEKFPVSYLRHIAGVKPMGTFDE